MSDKNGYEYEVVGYCQRTGRPIVAPIAWVGKQKDGTKVPRPRYATCTCCSR